MMTGMHWGLYFSLFLTASSVQASRGGSHIVDIRSEDKVALVSITKQLTFNP